MVTTQFLTPCIPVREGGDFSVTLGLGCDIQDHLDSVSGWKIGCEAAGLCKMGKNMALLGARAILPLNSAGTTWSMRYWIRVNGLHAVQRDAGKGGSYGFWLCLTSFLSPRHVDSKAKVTVRAELRWSPVSKVGRIYRNKVFFTVGILGFYNENRILLWFLAAVTISIWVSDWELLRWKYFVRGGRFGHHPKEWGCNLLFSLKILLPQCMPVVTPEWVTAIWSSTKFFPETTKDNGSSRKKCIIFYAACNRKDISGPEWHLFHTYTLSVWFG